MRSQRLRVRVTKPKLERSDAYEKAKPKYVMLIALTLPFAVFFIIFGVNLFFTRVEPFSRSSMLLLLAGGVPLLLYVLSRFRVRRGLEIGVEGLRWWRGADEITLSWRQIYLVQLSTTGIKNTVRVVEIIDRDLQGYELTPGQLGSDPHVVAEVIRHFVDKTNDREFLSEARVALALVTTPL